MAEDRSAPTEDAMTMTPAERALLVAIGHIVVDGQGGAAVHDAITAVQREAQTQPDFLALLRRARTFVALALDLASEVRTPTLAMAQCLADIDAALRKDGS